MNNNITNNPNHINNNNYNIDSDEKKFYFVFRRGQLIVPESKNKINAKYQNIKIDFESTGEKKTNLNKRKFDALSTSNNNDKSSKKTDQNSEIRNPDNLYSSFQIVPPGSTSEFIIYSKKNSARKKSFNNASSNNTQLRTNNTNDCDLNKSDISSASNKSSINFIINDNDSPSSTTSNTFSLPSFNFFLKELEMMENKKP